jgi:hypothetical protein
VNNDFSEKPKDDTQLELERMLKSATDPNLIKTLKELLKSEKKP